MVTIRYFARLREALGKASEQIDLPPGKSDLASLRHMLQGRGGNWAGELADGRNLRAAINQELAKGDTAIKDGDEIAFFPPVTGG